MAIDDGSKSQTGLPGGKDSEALPSNHSKVTEEIDEEMTPDETMEEYSEKEQAGRANANKEMKEFVLIFKNKSNGDIVKVQMEILESIFTSDPTAIFLPKPTTDEISAGNNKKNSVKVLMTSTKDYPKNQEEYEAFFDKEEFTKKDKSKHLSVKHFVTCEKDVFEIKRDVLPILQKLDVEMSSEHITDNTATTVGWISGAPTHLTNRVSLAKKINAAIANALEDETKLSPDQKHLLREMREKTQDTPSLYLSVRTVTNGWKKNKMECLALKMVTKNKFAKFLEVFLLNNLEEFPFQVISEKKGTAPNDILRQFIAKQKKIDADLKSIAVTDLTEEHLQTNVKTKDEQFEGTLLAYLEKNGARVEPTQKEDLDLVIVHKSQKTTMIETLGYFLYEVMRNQDRTQSGIRPAIREMTKEDYDYRMSLRKTLKESHNGLSLEGTWPSITKRQVKKAAKSKGAWENGSWTFGFEAFYKDKKAQEPKSAAGAHDNRSVASEKSELTRQTRRTVESDLQTQVTRQEELIEELRQEITESKNAVRDLAQVIVEDRKKAEENTKRMQEAAKEQMDQMVEDRKKAEENTKRMQEAAKEQMDQMWQLFQNLAQSTNQQEELNNKRRKPNTPQKKARSSALESEDDGSVLDVKMTPSTDSSDDGYEATLQTEEDETENSSKNEGKQETVPALDNVGQQS